MKFEFEIDENEVLGMLRDYFDNRITMDMVKDIVLKDEYVVSQIIMWGVTETETRSACVEPLAKKFSGMRWPMNGSSKEDKEEFQTKWDKAMGSGEA